MASFSDSLAKRVQDSPQFASAYGRLQVASLSGLTGEQEFLDEVLARKLAQSAVIFSQASLTSMQGLAQDIAYALVQTSQDELVHTACTQVLNTIGNFPASNFLSRKVQNITDSLPWIMQLEILGREHRNTFEVHERPVVFTDFQVDVWKRLSGGHQAVAIRAPTSAGKSFVLQSYLLERFAKADSPLTIAYVIPSRALLHEVQGALTSLLGRLSRKVRVTSVPQMGEAQEELQIFVFTQERLQTLFDSSDIIVNELIVDEAQQISDDSRGVLLQHCLEEALVRSPKTKLVLLTPGRQDAAAFAKQLGLIDVQVVHSSLRPVRQNLIYCDFTNSRPTDIDLSLHRESHAPLALGTLKTSWGFESKQSRLVGAAIELGREGQSLVYAPSKSPAESIATTIAGYIEPTKDKSEALSELVAFIKKHIHPKYALAECVASGVAFHYGSMPTALTKALEEYFSNGLLKYLVCTSTLLHGVNLPARNIFLYRPTRGTDKPLDADGFWNLAGRAGRMGKDIQGNVFLVDYADWESQPAQETAVVDVEPALKRALKESRSELIEYATSPKQQSGDEKKDFVESVFTRLCIDHAAGRLDATVELVLGNEAIHAEEMKLAVRAAMKQVELPYEVIKKSRLVSPVRQQALFEYFLSKIDRNEIDDLIPLHPLTDFKEGRLRLMIIFFRIDKYIRARKSNAAKYYSGLAMRWMRGDSLKNLIDSAVDYKVKTEQKDRERINYGTIIRTLMTEVENELRFQYVRYTTCYLEVLRYAFFIRNIDRAEEIPNLPLHLELGAASTTMISCLELGMSRIAAQEASEAMGNSRVTTEGVRKWLSRAPINGSLSPLVLREIERLGLREIVSA